MIRKFTVVLAVFTVLAAAAVARAQSKIPAKIFILRDRLEKFEGPLIPLPLNTDKPFVVTHIPVSDCRALRGFFGPPIDGTFDSPDYSGKRWEYNYPGTQANAGMRYAYLKNDGLHITLADRIGVNAIQIRGGVQADVITDCKQYDDPASGVKLFSFGVPNARYSLAYFDKPVAGDKFSFFNVKDGFIADLYFFRTGGDAAALGAAVKSPISGKADTTLLCGYFDKRFDASTAAAYEAFKADAAPVGETTFDLQGTATTHVVAGPFDTDMPISAVGLEGIVEGSTGTASLIVQVQDPIQPRLAITTAAMVVNGPGKLNLALDIPDQVLPKGHVLWVTVRSADTLTMKSPVLVLYKVSREQAAPGALAFRLVRLKGIYQVMSEARPWNNWKYSTRGGPTDDPDKFLRTIKTSSDKMFTSEIRDAIDHCTWLNPEDTISKQYSEWFYRRMKHSGLPPAQVPEEPGVPEWATVARAAWLTVRSVPEWWVNNRLVASGEFGGWDDDGSMYQNFADFVMYESDGVAAKLKAGAAARTELDQTMRLNQGLGKFTEDPLHFYEDSLNHGSLVTWWNYGDPIYVERSMLTSRNMESLTMVNDAGHRHFKSQTVGAEFLTKTKQPIDDDTGFGAQMMHPTCEVAFYNHNPRATKFLQEYCDAWLDHYAKAEPGKYPYAVDVATDKVKYGEELPLSGGIGCQAAMMAFMTRISGDAKYLKPLADYFAEGKYADWMEVFLTDVYSLGLMDDAKEGIASQYSRWPALQWMMTGEKKPLIEDLKRSINEIQTYKHIYTAAEPFTDRIFLGQVSAYTGVVNIVPGPTTAYTGGFATRNKPYHSHSVSWEGFGTDYAAFVRAGRRDRFHVIVFNFRNEPMKGAMRFWLLDHGIYEMTTGIDENGDDQIDGAGTTTELEVIKGDRVAIELPPRKVTVITLKQKTKLDPIEERADLALAARELTVKDGVLEGVAHNIGSKDVADAVVALVDASGAVVKKVSLGKLEAPLDLVARRVDFRVEGVPAEHAGWRVVLDPDSAVPEITEINNSALVP